jgi:methionine sulfoxide reductase heme-binding subunit
MSAAANALIPWTDRSGRFSILRAVVFAALLAPGAWLAWLGLQGQLGPRPVTAAIHDTGDWAVRFLLLSLLISPLRTATRWSELIGVRRMLGLGTFAYVFIHTILYIVDQRYDLIKVMSEIALRTYLTIGAALIGLAALSTTSNDAMVRRLGAERWNGLHRWTYLLTALALVHFFLQRKLEVFEPVLMSGLFLWLMGWRWLRRRSWASDLRGFAILAPAAAFATMLLEAAYLTVRHGAPFGPVFSMNLDFEYVIRPGARRAASASFFMRATIDLSPFDRCDERCAFSPSSSNLPTTSSPAISRAGLPEVMAIATATRPRTISASLSPRNVTTGSAPPATSVASHTWLAQPCTRFASVFSSSGSRGSAFPRSIT